MKKLMVAFCLATAILSCSGCASIYGVDSAWKNSKVQNITGTVEVDSSSLNFSLVAAPKDAHLAMSGSKTRLYYNLTLETSLEQYSNRSVGYAVVDADYTKNDKNEIVFINAVLVSADFSYMEPYIYTNLLPVVKNKLSTLIRSGIQ